MNLKKELSANQTLLLLMDSIEYNSIIVKTLKSLKGSSVCYITSNKTYDSLKELFNKKKINTKNIIFIDSISKLLKGNLSQTDNCYYISSPGALTELSLVINKFLRHNFNYLIFDSLTNLMTYTKDKTAIRFVSNLIDDIKKTKTRSLFYCMEIKEHESLIKQTSIMVDKVIKIGNSFKNIFKKSKIKTKKHLKKQSKIKKVTKR